MSAPGGGGLVDSRDFVNLRSWQLIKNGNIIEDTGTCVTNDDKKSNKEPLLKPEQSVPQVKRSSSEANLTDNQLQSTAIDQSTLSLSKSLGAKVFSDDFHSTVPEMFSSRSTNDDTDEFVDANETQGAESTTNLSHKSEEAEQIKDIAIDLCDKMYVVSGASIKYDHMPAVPKYTR